MSHTPAPWIFSFFCKPDGAPIQTVQDVADTIAGSAQYSERAELFGVTLDDAATNPGGRATVVCYTGNGPNAHNNARLMAAAPALLEVVRSVADVSRIAPLVGDVYEVVSAARAILAEIDGPECPTCGSPLGGSFPKCSSCQLVDALKAGE